MMKVMMIVSERDGVLFTPRQGGGHWSLCFLAGAVALEGDREHSRRVRTRVGSRVGVAHAFQSLPPHRENVRIVFQPQITGFRHCHHRRNPLVIY